MTLPKRGPRKLTRRQAIHPGQLLAGARPAAAEPPPPPTPLRHASAPTQLQAVADPALPPLNVIVLNRLAFGPRPGDLAAFNGLGANGTARLTAWVDQQLNPGAINDSACDTRLADAALSTLTKSLSDLWTDHYVGALGRTLPVTETRAATFIRAVYSKRQLQEVLADFWHNHFSIYAWDSSYASSTWVHFDRDVIRAHMLGNFREMLQAVSTSPAMLFYLDNYINQAAGFNENFARELFELHALGAENYLGVMNAQDVAKDGDGLALGYCDNDVYEAAACFTGWRVNNGSSGAHGNDGSFFYYETWHDTRNKLVLGQYMVAYQAAMKDGNDVLDILAAHPGTARFIARKLCRRLVADDPPQALVDEAAAVFLAHTQAPDQLKKVVRAIALSDAFKATWGHKIKRPFEATVAALRATDAEFTPSSSFISSYDAAGQALFSRRSPEGYPDVRSEWANTNALLQRWRLVNRLVQGSITSVSVDLLAQMPGSLTTPAEIADFWINRLLGRPMDPAANRDEIISFMAQGRNPDFPLPGTHIPDRLPHLVALILMSPDFQWR